MYRIYQGSKICAGCGVSGKEKSRRSADSLCYDCQRLLELGKGVREKDDLVFDFDTDVKGNPFQLRMRDGDTDFYSEMPKIGSNNLSLRFWELLRSLDCGKRDVKNKAGRVSAFAKTISSHPTNSPVYSIEKSQAIALFHLWDAIAHYSIDLFEEGQKRGQSLLVGLATGDISIERFNDAVTKNSK